MTSTFLKTLTFILPASLVVVGITGLGNTARGEELNQVTVTSSSTRIVGYHRPGLTPIEESTVKVKVTYDPVTLTTHSGVALLQDAVAQAALQACTPVDSPATSDHSCERAAINDAQPQIVQAIGRARDAEND
jgi:UrcA family protein